MSTNVGGDDGQDSGRSAKGSSPLDDLTPEWLAEIAIPGDTAVMVRVALWLEGKAELPIGEVQELLPRLPDLFYERHRIAIAEKLGVRIPVLDQFHSPSRASHESVGQGTTVGFAEPDPWPESVDGGVLLDDLAALFRKYIVLPDRAATALALWTTFAWLHDRFQVSPLLVITSPQKRCGKTTLLAVLSQLVPRPLPVANMTAAALFRTIEVFSPTVLADEADTYFSDNQELRGVLNTGHMRSQAYVVRCTEPDFKPHLFKVWGPKAIALIGRLTGTWSTLADRSIIVPLQRKRGDECVERMRLDRLPGETEELRRKLVRWTADIGPVFPELEPPELPFLNDRAADNWRPLLAIACAASDAFATDTWLDRAQQAARMLSAREEDDDIRVVLLEDLRALYAQRTEDWLGSTEIVEALKGLEDRPWADYARGKGLTTAGLGNLLRPFGVKSKQRKQPIGKNLRGYYLSELEPVFGRYLDTVGDKSSQDEEISGRTSVAGNTSGCYPGEGDSGSESAEAPQGATCYEGATDHPDLTSFPDNEIDDTLTENCGVAAATRCSDEETVIRPGEKDFVI